MAFINQFASEASHALGRKVVGQHVSETVARDLGETVSKKAAGTFGHDVLLTGAKKVAEDATNPAFDAALVELKAFVHKNGEFQAMPAALQAVLDSVKTTEEAARFAHLAQKYAINNRANRAPMVDALWKAVEKAKTHEDAHLTLRTVVAARETTRDFFLFPRKNDLVDAVIDKYMRIGGMEEEDLARKALNEVEKGWLQPSQRKAVHRLLLKDTLKEKITSIANYINKALK